MNSPNFASLLDKPSTDIEKPKPLPVGTYLFAINGLYKEGESTQKKTPYVEFTCNVIGAQEDVDEDALKEMGGYVGKSLRNTYYLTEDSIWRLNEFLTEHLGLDGADKSLRQLLDETPGAQFLGSVRHEASQDGTAVYARIGKTAAAE